ncbi:hypothetical protein G3580_07550 [Nitrogeniibacter mangrovi]|uniref:ABC-type transport auxiliary lipoprotein component domain-containing protein n=1 Tax=Nitrogeniibacter mangrovi TaxID=2016596 RepID=A0A6C1B5E4_9RHOO|nr:ABC-type transport auxiliary lipoprotein family protein [Nitrogeniibacter mangrovi]QID17510.1 hypothetical protein G3580_07550 [Nitrogeniibacter mangrovi]
MRRFDWRWCAALLMALAVSACSSFGKPESPPTIFDIAPLDGQVRQVAVPMTDLEVLAPSWLASSAMQYRLEPVSRLERRFYSTSRWAGMPAEMLEVAFGRMLQTQPAPNGAGCRLRVQLDEFIQRFDTAATSSGLIEMRASLLAPRTDVIVAYRSFSVARPAPTADAAGGVVALRDGVHRLGNELGDWLVSLPAGPSDQGVIARCAH